MFCNIVNWAQIGTPYIIFRNVDFFKNIGKKILKENKEFDGIFERISSVKMKISKIN
jgi:hypothetical protein